MGAQRSKIAAECSCVCLALAISGCNGHWDSSIDDRYSSRFHDVVPAGAALHAPSVDAMTRVHVDVGMQGDSIRIATRYGERGLLNNIGRNNQGRIDYVVHAPANLAVRVENVSGDVKVKNVHNDVDVHDVSGSITAEDIVGSDAGTTSGDTIAGVLAVKPSQRFKLYSVSSDVTLTIPKHTGADVKASSISGNFSSNLPVKSEERTVGSQVDQQLGGGEAQIALNTVSGAMKLAGK